MKTKAALAQSNKQLGNPRWKETIHKAHAGNSKAADDFAAEVYPTIRELQKDGIQTLSGLSRALNGKCTTAKGGKWYPSTVKNLIGRIETRSIL